MILGSCPHVVHIHIHLGAHIKQIFLKDNNDEGAALANSYSEHIKSEKKF